MKLDFGKDMTTGSIPRQLVRFSLPIFIGNLIYSGYGVVNMIWVGRLVGRAAVGAVAVSLPVIFILSGLVMGATTAVSVLVAQYCGSKDKEMLDRTVGTSFTLSLIASLVLTIAGLLSSGWILRAMNTPIEIFPLARGYLDIMLSGTVFMFMYLLIAAILRGMGDSVTMIVIMALSTVLNAVLDPLLIAGAGPVPKLGLNGAAIASLVSQGVALAGAFLFLRLRNAFRLNLWLFRPNLSIAARIARIALPSVLQACFVQAGAMFITSFVNAYGADATAALGAAGRVDSIALMPAAALNMAVSTQAGQCIGADREERLGGLFKWGALINLLATLPVALLAAFVPDMLLGMFLRDSAALALGAGYLRVLFASYMLASVFYVSNGIMTGAGRTILPMAVSLISLWAVRIPLAAALMRTGLGIQGIWLAVLVSFAVNFAASLALFGSGAWKKRPAVKLPAQPDIIMPQGAIGGTRLTKGESH